MDRWCQVKEANGLSAPEAEYKVFFLQFTCGLIMTLEEAQDGHVAKGLGGIIEMSGNQKVMLIGAYRAQMLRESVFGLSAVEEATSGATVARDFESRSAGNAGDAVEGIMNHGRGEVMVLEVGGHLGCRRVECFIPGADVVEVEEFGVWDRIFVRAWVRGGVVKVSMGVGGFEVNVDAESVAGDGPGEFEVGVKGVGEVDELFELLMGVRGSTDAVINIAEEEVTDGASVTVEEGLFYVSYREAGIAQIHAGKETAIGSVLAY
eukprot:g38325.t1